MDSIHNSQLFYIIISLFSYQLTELSFYPYTSFEIFLLK